MPAPSPKEKNLHGLAKTLQILAKTPNEAAVGALIPALDSPQGPIQDGALQAILERRSPLGQREVLKRLHTAGERWRPIIGERAGRLSHALRDGVLGSDAQLCANACQAILWFREYDLMSVLITAAEDETHERSDLAATTLFALAQLLYEELSSPRDYNNRRDPQMVRNHVTGSLEASVKRFSKHQRHEITEAFLVLANRDNATLKQILQDPHHASYLPLVDGLMHCERGGVVRLLLSFIDDPHAPSAAISVLVRRSDRKFVQNLLRKIGFEPAAVAMQNLKKIESISWLRGDFAMLGELDEASQHSVVQLAMATSMKRLEAFKVVEFLLAHGKAGGRRAAVRALAGFNGAEANQLALAALDDVDARVQAAAVSQLRPRGIPGALGRLVEMVDSPHDAVRQAARESLAEFNFERYLAAYDMLDDEVRQSTGALVKKINPECIGQLAQELKARSRTRRLRALAIALSLRAAAELETTIHELLVDEDHVVRSEAARVLAQCDTPATRQALREALADRSVVVQEAAQLSLQALGPAARDVPNSRLAVEQPA